MLLLSLVLCAPQFDLSQTDFHAHFKLHSEHNSLRDSAGGTDGARSFVGFHGEVEASTALNEYADLVLKGHFHADDEDSELDITGYLDLDQMWGDSQIRVGRFSFGFGDGRVISSNEWRIEENIHDALLVQSNLINTDFDFFVSKAVHGVASDFEDRMIGAHGEYNFGSSGLIESYMFKRQQDILGIEEYDFVFRLNDRTDNGLDYDLMFMLQNGSDLARDITANAYVIKLSKQLDFGHGVGIEVAVAQGDGDNPAVRQRYNPGMIDYHKFNGRADILAFSNLMDFSFNYWLNWNERWVMHVDAHSFARESTSDGVYFGPEVSYAAASSANGSIASEIDLYLVGDISDEFSLDFGISLFVPQDSIVHDKEQYVAFIQAEYAF
ncbi:MAG: hypothetical protein ACI84O_001163 [Myxococcota bacterium]|jgi:hypothetical protein